MSVAEPAKRAPVRLGPEVGLVAEIAQLLSQKALQVLSLLLALMLTLMLALEDDSERRAGTDCRPGEKEHNEED